MLRFKALRDRFHVTKLAMFGDREIASALHAPLSQAEWDAFGQIERERAAMGELSHGSKKPHDARFIYRVVRALRPQTVLELGTNVGISSSYIALALPPGGKVITLDVRELQLNTAKALHKRLGLSDRVAYVQGRFENTLADTLRTYGPIDFAFIDGAHKKAPTLSYTEQISAAASDRAVFIYDDIRWTDEMKETWQILGADPRFGVVVDLKMIGITRLAEKGSTRRYVTPRLATVLQAS